MRKKLIAVMLAFGLVITSVTFTAAPAEAATKTNQSSSDDELSTGDFHIKAKKLKGDGSDSLYKSKNGKVNSSTKGTDSYWNQFSGSVYYNQLGSDEKALYNKLKNLANSYLNGTSDVTSKAFSDGSYSYVTESVTQSGVNIDEALDVATIFLYENPQFYFIDSSTLPYTESYSGSWWFNSLDTSWTLSFKVYSAYADGTARKNYTDQFKAAVDSYISGASAYSSDLAKETYFHDQLATKVSYNTAAANSEQTEETSESQSASSAFLKNSTVCAGYTKAFSLLLNSQGIKNVGVTSNTHAWNEVQINGNWYICDLTWDQNQWPTHDFFNISESELRAKDQMVTYDTFGWWSIGTMGNEWVHTPLSYYSTLRPACMTAHTSDVDAIDLTAAQQTGESTKDDTSTTGGTTSDNGTGTTDTNTDTNQGGTTDTDTGTNTDKTSDGNTGTTQDGTSDGNTDTNKDSTTGENTDTTKDTTSDGNSDSTTDNTATNKNPEPKKIETSKPVKPSSFTVKRVRKGTLQLTIKTKTRVDAYFVRYRVKGTNKWKSVYVEVNGKSLTFIIGGLKAGKTYQLRAYSVDSDGNRSNPTKIRTKTA